MAASPSSPLTAPPEPVTPPSPWTITDGAISGTLPAAEAFAVHYPGYPSSPARAARTLGGLPGLAKALLPEILIHLQFQPCSAPDQSVLMFVRAAPPLPLRSGVPIPAPASSSASAPRTPTAIQPLASPAPPLAFCCASPSAKELRHLVPMWSLVSGLLTTSKVSAPERKAFGEMPRLQSLWIG
jgi:hypothetical protein